MYYSRVLEKEVSVSLKSNPVTVILGPRQCGKSTLAKKILEAYPDSLYLDLERPSDLEKLNDAEWFLQSNPSVLIFASLRIFLRMPFPKSLPLCIGTVVHLPSAW